MKILSRVFVLLFLTFCFPVAEVQAADHRPNIIIILVDDLGFRDTGFQGSDYYETPTLDRLAEESLRFTNAYSPSPLCSPSRAAILTGQTPARLGITRAIIPPFHNQVPGEEEYGHPADELVEPQIRDRLPESLVTLPEVLREAGYHTAIVGKWHLGPEEVIPTDHGFDTNIAGSHHPGPPKYFSPYRLEDYNLADGPKGEYITNRIGQEAGEWLLDQGDDPYFLLFSTFAVHYPFEAPGDLVDHFAAKSKGNMHRNEIYAAMIKALDQSVATVLEAVEASGQEDRTIIIFTSDNGGLLRLNAPSGSRSRDLPHRNLKSMEFITSNTPFSGGKSSIQEGGVRVPLLVKWPGDTDPGTVSDVPVILHDLYPTILDIVGLEQPVGQPVDGTNLVPVLKGSDTLKREQPITVHFPHSGRSPRSSIRVGDWKLVHGYDLEPDGLYNLQEDPGERRNLAAEFPEKAEAMREQLFEVLESQSAMLPRPNKNHRPGFSDKDVKTIKQVQGWEATGSAMIVNTPYEGPLTILSTGRDPNLISPVFEEAVEAPLTVSIEARYRASGRGEVFWREKGGGNFSGRERCFFTTLNDGEWHEYKVNLPIAAKIDRIRIDPCGGSGIVEIRSIRIMSDGSSFAGMEWIFDE